MTDNIIPNKLYKALNKMTRKEESTLGKLFFSKQNLDFLQDSIIYSVYENSELNFRISRQSDVELSLVMQNIYEEHDTNKQSNLAERVNELNKLVLKLVVPHIISGIIARLKYLKDASEFPEPIDYPVSVSNRNCNVVSLDQFPDE